MHPLRERTFDYRSLLDGIRGGDYRHLARAISLIENEVTGYESLLVSLPAEQAFCPVVGVTGAPGAGKSTLVDALVAELDKRGKKVAILCVDPSSPFHEGALLGDRIRMSHWQTHPGVFIRSLASRGSSGGLSPKIIEITDLVRAAGFDLVLVETVGAGQNEVEIAALADFTVVVFVPESGDEVQMLKAGLMEIADVFVVNKSDRPEAVRLVADLERLGHYTTTKREIYVLQTVATRGEGVEALLDLVLAGLARREALDDRRVLLLTEKAFQLILRNRAKEINRKELAQAIRHNLASGRFQLYQFTFGYGKTL